MEKLRIIVGGLIGLYPTGGATWDYIQYPLGFKLLGHDVYYVEDTMQYPVYQLAGDKWDDCTFSVEYLRRAMASLDLDDRWAYRDVASGCTFGMSERRLDEVCASADVFINVSLSTFLRDAYREIPVRILIDTDPMFTQYQYLDSQAQGGAHADYAAEFMRAHTDFFTFGLNIGKADCRVPTLGLEWKTTVKPTCLSCWENSHVPTDYGFTSIINWVERPDFEYDGDTWGQKNKTFRQYAELPVCTGEPFEIIINRPDDPATMAAMDRLRQQGWQILDPEQLTADKDTYRSFIQRSRAEFSISKETYIKSRSGWFSGRSACYLAAGKPVITQDTGWSSYLRAGEGLFAVNSPDEAADAVECITADYGRQSAAARAIAAEYFDSSKVLSRLLEQVSAAKPS